MTNKIVKYTGIATAVLGLAGGYYSFEQNKRFGERKDLTELHAIRNMLGERSGLKYVSNDLRVPVVRQLEARVTELEANPEIMEADKTRMNYFTAGMVLMAIGVVPIAWYTRSRREEE